MQVTLIKNNKFWIEPETEFESQFLSLNFEGQSITGFLKLSGEKIQGLVIEAVDINKSVKVEDDGIASFFEESDGFLRKEYSIKIDEERDTKLRKEYIEKVKSYHEEDSNEDHEII